MSSKLCPHCQTIKPLELFYRRRIARDGRASWCITCQRARNRVAFQRAAYGVHPVYAVWIKRPAGSQPADAATAP